MLLRIFGFWIEFLCCDFVLGNMQVSMPSKWFPVDLYTYAAAQIQPAHLSVSASNDLLLLRIPGFSRVLSKIPRSRDQLVQHFLWLHADRAHLCTWIHCRSPVAQIESLKPFVYFAPHCPNSLGQTFGWPDSQYTDS